MSESNVISTTTNSLLEWTKPGTLTLTETGSGTLSVYGGNGTITASSHHLSSIYTLGYKEDASTNNSTSAIFPSITFMSCDENQKQINLKLNPEFNSLSVQDALKLSMLLFTANSINYNNSFSVYQFIKKNDLERHFKFETF